nr:MAG TPA: Major capsid protein [Microviridae sp.]
MANVFNKIADIKNNVKRNSFDWSHDNNFTTDLGRITPVFTELVPPNSSVRIKPEFGLRFMPMMFPIQTKMKAYLSFFKVPLRTLWSDYMDFISADNTEEYQPPYMMFTPSDYSEGGCLRPSGLGDYFGIPTEGAIPPTIVSGYSPAGLNLDPRGRSYDTQTTNQLPVAGNDVTLGSSLNQQVPAYNESSCNYDYLYNVLPLGQFTGRNKSYGNKTLTVSFDIVTEVGPTTALASYIRKCGRFAVAYFGTVVSAGGNGKVSTKVTDIKEYSFGNGLVQETQGATYTYFRFSCKFDVFTDPDGLISGSFGLFFPSVKGTDSSPIWNTDGTMFGTRTIENVTFTTAASSRYPFEGTGAVISNPVKLSAYPFRAYEAIYNAYIRNTRNNPFVLNGKKTYNKWITTDAGGPDSLTPKSLFYANWQSDAYTTALQAPQQGTAPLVGLTTYETRSLNDAGHEVTTINTAIVDEDGNAYKVDFESNGEALKGVTYTPLKAGELVNPQALASPVTSGISINDFRNVNAYQRYLELNQFRGFSYKEIIEGRFDVNVRYDALSMPEYLGGITRDIVVNPITQTVETSSTGSYVGALGSQAGLATCFGNSDGSISVFCDEESIIMGIMYVMPMPVYDSLLPKWLTYRERLDSFNPEFDHIGYQPIYNKELALWQAASEDETKINQVFGYQRPWYEYVQKLDRAHGLFLSSLRNFIMFRSFENTPELGQQFTVMQPGSVNNVFTVTEVSDKILGQIHFDCTAQLPISRVVVPRLE